MQNYPHNYLVNATTKNDTILLSSHDLPNLLTAPPVEFDGPGDLWSPETMFTGAVANCFILTFKAIARASKFEWHELNCSVTCVLDRVDKVTRFTQINIQANLEITADKSTELAQRLLEKAENACLITNSLNVKPTLNTVIKTTSQFDTEDT